jgi:DNA-directed RNA polymerase subunit alpha
MDKSVKLNPEITIEKGRGFVPAEKESQSYCLGTIFTDSIYTPVECKYAIENFRGKKRIMKNCFDIVLMDQLRGIN